MRTDQVLVSSSGTAGSRGQLAISVIIVSFNTKSVLRKCLEHLSCAREGLRAEVIVVDNNSRDGSRDMVAREFPDVRLIRSPQNLGFAAANNLAFRAASGQYLVLLNSDAFVSADSLSLAFHHMEADRAIGAGGARLVGTDNSWQPSARMFPSILNSMITFTGLASRFPKSRFLGRADRTWSDAALPADADWVPGAFTIIPREALDKIGDFDESFFLYYEEVDLCRRLRNAGYRVRYFPDLVVVHLGGESSKTQDSLSLSASGKQLILWRLRSEFLYYRKHHGNRAYWVMRSERFWHSLRLMRNIVRGAGGRAKADQSRSEIMLIDQAWRETQGGRNSPPRPW